MICLVTTHPYSDKLLIMPKNDEDQCKMIIK